MSDARWVLELLGGDGRSVELPESGMLVIGSSRERAGFVVEGQGVDEAHCAVGRTKEGDFGIKDLGSRYGTVLNGQRVAAARLKLGDQLVLGSRRLEVRPARASAGSMGSAPVGSARPSDVPQRVGGYRVERLIGKGGMGAVYLAVQESLRRPVALKVLSARLASDADFVRRFQAEARAAAALSHPNVVVVYDVGEDAGAHYLSMEFMAGGSLEQKLAAGGPLAWKAVLAVLGDAAAGLAYAESRGIVHRDIKPANLMYSGTGTVKIADLGLATTLEEEASVGEGGRKVYGTPHFISPEQARGAPVDHRSDLYSLGATAYRLLSGKTPFEGASTRDILRALQNDAPRPLATLVPELPRELDALIARLMEKDPAARFPSAEALRRECERLRLLTEHGPALAERRGSRRPLAVALVVLGALGAGAVWYASRPPAALSPSGKDGAGANDPVTEAPASSSPTDDAFLAGAPAPAPAHDEEGALRVREREAARELRELPAVLGPEERARELTRIQAAYAGTSAAEAAARELAALRSAPGPESGTDALNAALDEAEGELRATFEASGASSASLAAELARIDDFRPSATVGAEFEARRAAFAEARIQAAEERVRATFTRATALALDGRFEELRAELAALAPLFAGLDDVPDGSGRLDALRGLRAELAARRARVDEEERFYLADVERRARRTLGEALGPGSGLSTEVVGLELEALGARMARLAPELAGRPLARALGDAAGAARAALDALQREFAAGGWRRKSLVDPRSKRVREVRDVRPEGLVFDKDGALETVSWREAKADPEWWQQLFQGRLAREWDASEARAIAELLHLMGAARAAGLAREMIDPRGRGTLAPGELVALAAAFDPALAWLDGAPSEARAALERERALAQRLSRALEAAQARTWTTAAAELERILSEGEGSLLVGLVSDGRDWRAEKR